MRWLVPINNMVTASRLQRSFSPSMFARVFEGRVSSHVQSGDHAQAHTLRAVPNTTQYLDSSAADRQLAVVLQY